VAVVLDLPGASLVALASILGGVLLLEGACLIAVELTTAAHTGALAPVAADSPHPLTTVPRCRRVPHLITPDDLLQTTPASDALPRVWLRGPRVDVRVHVVDHDRAEHDVLEGTS
jgi:hypothetical protein